MELEILTDQYLLSVIGWLLVTLLTGSIVLVVYIWNERKKQVESIHGEQVEFNKSMAKYMNTTEKMNALNSATIIEVSNDIKFLFKSAKEHTDKIHKHETDIEVLKIKINQNGNGKQQI